MAANRAERDREFNRRASLLERISVEDLDKLYKDSQISAWQRNQLVREKAHLTGKNRDYLETVFKRSIENIQKGWDTLTELKAPKPTDLNLGPAGRAFMDTTESLITLPWNAAKAMWGQIQILTSIMDAFGETNGDKAEALALSAGASPGVARLINISMNVGTQVLPVGKAAKSFAKGVQQRGGKPALDADKTQAGTQLELVPQEESVLQRAMVDALKAEGLEAPKASKIIKQSVEEVGEKAVEITAESSSKTIQKQPLRMRAAAGKFKLPPELAGAKPRWRDREVEFANDLDKALYILAQDKRSAADARYLAEVQKAYPDMPEGTIRSLGRFVKSHLKTLANESSDIIKVEPYGEHLFQAKKLTRLAERAAREDSTQAHQAFFRELVDSHAGLTPKEKAAYGQQFMSILREMAPEEMAKGNTPTAMLIVAQDFAKLAGRPDNVARFLSNLTRISSEPTTLGIGFGGASRDMWYGFRELYINTLMPFAWSASAVGNTLSSGAMLLERFAGAAFSLDRSAGMVMKEPWYQIKGMTLATGDALQAFAKAFNERTLNELATTFGMTKHAVRNLSQQQINHELQKRGIPASNILGQNKLDFIPGEIDTVIGRLVRVPSSATTGIDNITKTMLYRGSIYSSAIRQVERDPALLARFGGDHGRAVEFLWQNPSRAMIEEAQQFALTGTFQNDLGKIASMLRKVQTGPGFLYAPFMKTPIDLTKFVWNRTPGLQLMSDSLYKDILEGGAKADMAVGRLTISNLFAMYLYEMSKEGYLTGRKPVDPKLQGAWLANNREYSVKHGGKFTSIQNMEPISPEFGMMADLVQIMDQLDEPTASQAWAAIVLSITQNLGNNQWFSNFTEVAAAIQGIKTGRDIWPAIGRIAAAPMTTLVTGGPAGQRIRAIMDPVVRDSYSFMNHVVGKTPWGSTAIPASRDSFGVPRIPKHTNWFGMLGPIAPVTQESDTAWHRKEAERLNANMPEFERAVGQGSDPTASPTNIREMRPGDRIPTRLTNSEWDQWQQIYMETVNGPEGLPALERDAEYLKSDPATRRLTYESIASGFKQAAFGTLLEKNPNLVNRMSRNLENWTSAFTGAVPEPGDMTDLRGLTDTLSPSQRDNLLKWGYSEEEIAQ